ncbi:MAG: hypothetical protein ACFE9L_04735 [Candidatus Hodarchaeota archaeon]
MLDTVALVKYENNIRKTLETGIGLINGFKNLRSSVLIKPNICTQVDKTGFAVNDVQVVEALINLILKENQDLSVKIVESDSMSKFADEVFILQKGNCILFIGEGNEMRITKLYAKNMVPYKIYNIKRGVWHNHVLSRDAMILIVENQDTTESNSPIIKLTKKQKKEITDLATRL